MKWIQDSYDLETCYNVTNYIFKNERIVLLYNIKTSYYVLNSNIILKTFIFATK